MGGTNNKVMARQKRENIIRIMPEHFMCLEALITTQFLPSC